MDTFHCSSQLNWWISLSEEEFPDLHEVDTLHDLFYKELVYMKLDPQDRNFKNFNFMKIFV